MFRAPDGVMLSILQLSETALGYEESLSIALTGQSNDLLENVEGEEDEGLQEIKDLLNQIKI